MSEYEYSRGWDGERYLIDNAERVDGEGNQIYLAQEVKATLPGKSFKSFGNDDLFTFIFDETLTVEEETTLDNTVTSHKNNT